jgi:hypothetical protein
MFTNKILEAAIVKFKKDKRKSKLSSLFQELSECCYNHYSKYNFKLEPKNIIKECVLVCFEKTEKFDPSKGKAFCYFSTICSSTMLQYKKVKNGYRIS